MAAPFGCGLSAFKDRICPVNLAIYPVRTAGEAMRRDPPSSCAGRSPRRLVSLGARSV